MENKREVNMFPDVPCTLSLTEKGRLKEAEADREIKEGRFKSFNSVEDLIKDLNNED